jgi:hypothetical protein
VFGGAISESRRWGKGARVCALAGAGYFYLTVMVTGAD